MITFLFRLFGGIFAYSRLWKLIAFKVVFGIPTEPTDRLYGEYALPSFETRAGGLTSDFLVRVRTIPSFIFHGAAPFQSVCYIISRKRKKTYFWRDW